MFSKYLTFFSVLFLFTFSFFYLTCFFSFISYVSSRDRESIDEFIERSSETSGWHPLPCPSSRSPQVTPSSFKSTFIRLKFATNNGTKKKIKKKRLILRFLFLNPLWTLIFYIFYSPFYVSFQNDKTRIRVPNW